MTRETCPILFHGLGVRGDRLPGVLDFALVFDFARDFDLDFDFVGVLTIRRRYSARSPGATRGQDFLSEPSRSPGAIVRYRKERAKKDRVPQHPGEKSLPGAKDKRSMRRRDADERWLENDAEDLRRTRRHAPMGRRVATWLVPSLLLNLVFVWFLRPDDLAKSPGTQTYELDLVEPKPPALPPKARRAQRKSHTQPRPKMHRPRRARRSTPRAITPPPPPVALPKPTTPPKKIALPSLLRMRPTIRPRQGPGYLMPPEPKVDVLRAEGRRIRRRRYADGGRLLTNLSPSRKAAPERARYYRTGKAPKGDIARLSLAGLASILGGGRRGKVCDHFKRFPVRGKHRTVHLLIDSSPSMSGSITPAETCAIGVALSALDQGFKVAIGRFGSSTICHPPTDKSALLRDVIVNQKRIGGTRIPSTCGADRAKGPVDVVIITDGGFFNADVARLLEARRVVAKPKNRGLLYLVPDPRFGANDKALAAFRRVGFRVVRFGPSARRHAAETHRADTDGA
ncbi:MAG: hypothetical protein KAI47_15550 [Deltaproteobacteria bacterium]|nr:hypothetical protein [Deltaproteobacteria bacterium]